MDLESNVHESLRSVKLKGVLSERSIDPLLPIEPPRRHITRLEIYSDALFSIIATINILPIMEALKEQPLPDSTEILSGFVGYFVNFSITCLIYRLHFERFNRAKKFFLGLLPFASNLIYHALDLTLPYVFHAILVLILWIIGSFMTIYINIFSDDDLRFTMAYVRVLRDSQHLGNHLLALFMHFIVILMGVSIVIILAFFVPQDALYGYIFIILAEYLLIWLLRKVDRTEFFDGKKLSKKTNKIMRTVTTKSCHRERCCAFSDGIFAISITLVAVNLRVPEIGEEDLEQLYSELLSMWPQYVSYAFSFIIIGIWWYWHYKMFHLVEWITPGLNLANFSFLNLIGLFPAVSEAASSYYSIPDSFGTSFRLLCTAIVLTGAIQAGCWAIIVSQLRGKSNSHMLRTRNVALMFIGICVCAVIAAIAFSLSMIDGGEVYAASSLFTIPLVVLLIFVVCKGFKKTEIQLNEQLHINSH